MRQERRFWGFMTFKINELKFPLNYFEAFHDEHYTYFALKRSITVLDDAEVNDMYAMLRGEKEPDIPAIVDKGEKEEISMIYDKYQISLNGWFSNEK